MIRKKSARPIAALFLLSAAASCMLLASCAGPRQSAGPPPSWPSPPYPTRIVWTGAASYPQDLGISPGFWGTIWRKIAGGEPDSIGRPYGIHADCRKRILVVDSQKRGIHLFDRASGNYYFIGGNGKETFNLPICVTEDRNDTAYVTDAAAGKVFRFSLTERRPTVFAAGLKRPTGIAYNPVNRLVYVTDTLAGQIVAFDANGKEQLRFGRPGHGEGELNHPTDLAVDIRGRIYVTDAINARIQIFSADGTFVRTFGQAGDTAGYFGKPKGVAVNSDGHIYVCDALHDVVQVFNRDGQLLFTFGATGSGKGEFWMPSGIAIDKDDNVYVADTFNKRIQIFSYVWLDQ